MDSELLIPRELDLYRHYIFVSTQWTSVSINTSIPVPRSSIPMPPIHRYSSIPIPPILQYHQYQCRQYCSTINTNTTNTSILIKAFNTNSRESWYCDMPNVDLEETSSLSCQIYPLLIVQEQLNLVWEETITLSLRNVDSLSIWGQSIVTEKTTKPLKNIEYKQLSCSHCLLPVKTRSMQTQNRWKRCRVVFIGRFSSW
jgi:hypothetical protein